MRAAHTVAVCTGNTWEGEIVAMRRKLCVFDGNAAIHTRARAISCIFKCYRDIVQWHSLMNKSTRRHFSSSQQQLAAWEWGSLYAFASSFPLFHSAPRPYEPEYFFLIVFPYFAPFHAAPWRRRRQRLSSRLDLFLLRRS